MSIESESAVREPLAPVVSIPRTNRLLASLPEDEYRRVSPHLRPVALRARQNLLRFGQPVQELVFPVAGVCSLVKTTEDGHTIELLGVGYEGAVGVSVAWGHAESTSDVVVQISDSAALSLPLDVFKAEWKRGGALAASVSEYSRTWTIQLMQACACNALHSAEERCCRWLLTTHDRVGAYSFSITQEMFAMALGLRRPTVTLIMADLHRDGLVAYTRGRITILNRPGLLERACECYAYLSPGRD